MIAKQGCLVQIKKFKLRLLIVSLNRHLQDLAELAMGGQKIIQHTFDYAAISLSLPAHTGP